MVTENPYRVRTPSYSDRFQGEKRQEGVKERLQPWDQKSLSSIHHLLHPTPGLSVCEPARVSNTGAGRCWTYSSFFTSGLSSRTRCQSNG